MLMTVATSTRRRTRLKALSRILSDDLKETESQTVREELLKHMATSQCQQCHGSRLNEFARNVFVNQLTCLK